MDRRDRSHAFAVCFRSSLSEFLVDAANELVLKGMNDKESHASALSESFLHLGLVFTSLLLDEIPLFE